MCADPGIQVGARMCMRIRPSPWVHVPTCLWGAVWQVSLQLLAAGAHGIPGIEDEAKDVGSIDDLRAAQPLCIQLMHSTA